MRKQHAVRCGYTLIELVATLSLLLMIGVMAASMLGAVTRIGADTKQHRQSTRNVTRLDRIFRADIHAATAIELKNEGQHLVLTCNDHTIDYRCQLDPPVITRELAGSRSASVDSFQLSSRCEPTIVLGDVISLQLTAKNDAAVWLIEVQRP